jgi:HK97 gp10 family phage protein
MAEIIVKVTGLDEVEKYFDTIKKQSTRELAISMDKVVTKVSQDAKSLAPVDTGFLRDSINHQVSLSDVSVIGKVLSPAPYSFYQEFGSIKNPATFFLTNATEQNLKFIEDELREALRQATVVGRLF